MVESHGVAAIGLARRAITIVEGVSGDRRRFAMAALEAGLDDPVVYAIDAYRPTLQTFAGGLCRALKRIAPGARFSFARAFALAAAAPDPVRHLTTWLTVHLERLHPTIVIEGFERLEDARGDALRLVGGLARSGAVDVVVVVDSLQGLPLARWLADGLCGAPIPLAALPARAAIQAVPVGGIPRDPRESLLRAVSRGSAERAEVMLRAFGLELIDTGDADAVAEALDLIGTRVDDPMMKLLFAMCESRFDRVDLAEAWFRRALDAARDGAERATIAHRFAAEFVRRARYDVIDVLAPHLDDERIDPLERAAMLAVDAEGRIMHGDRTGAIDGIARALQMGSPDGDALRHARLHARAAFVYHNAGDFERATEFAATTVRIAEAGGFDDIAASAASVLQGIAYDAGGPGASLSHLYAIARYAVRSSNRSFHIYALTAAFELEAERANLAALGVLEEELRAYDIDVASPPAAECLTPARAMVAAWSGAFRHAYDLISGTIEHQTRDDGRSLRFAEAALYAAAAGDAAAARAALERYETTLPEGIDVRGRDRARLFTALARYVLGEPVEAPILSVSTVRDDALYQAVATILSARGNATMCEAAWTALDRLYAVEYGGVARLIAALPAGNAR